MMRKLILLSLLLTGCSPPRDREPNPESYQRIRDRMIVRFHLEPLTGWPCTYPATEDGVKVLESLPADQCYRFNPPAQITGIWHNEFEGSLLVTPAEAEQLNRHVYPKEDTWITTEDAIRAHPPKGCDRDGCPEGDYRVTFIGRRTSYPGHYGHMSGSRNLVLMDRLISIEKIPDDWSRPKPTESAVPQ